MKPILYEEHRDFLDEEYFKHLYNIIKEPCNHFQWSFQENVAFKGNDDQDGFYFIHPVFEQNDAQSNFHNELQGVYNALGVRALLRTRVIMYVNQGKQIIHAPHVDFQYSHKAALLYLNTNNGYTLMADEDCEIRASQDLENLEFFRDDTKDSPFKHQFKSMSERNKCTIHNGSRPHCSSTCTDAKSRILIAINYF
tara:strand:- start:1976 stop:2563 length:588 start_codon:yes stop_codon:yes gene_type:complete